MNGAEAHVGVLKTEPRKPPTLTSKETESGNWERALRQEAEVWASKLILTGAPERE